MLGKRSLYRYFKLVRKCLMSGYAWPDGNLFVFTFKSDGFNSADAKLIHKEFQTIELIAVWESEWPWIVIRVSACSSASSEWNSVSNSSCKRYKLDVITFFYTHTWLLYLPDFICLRRRPDPSQTPLPPQCPPVAIEGRLRNLLPRWFRTGWPSVISQGQNPLKVSAVDRNWTSATGRTNSERDTLFLPLSYHDRLFTFVKSFLSPFHST